MAQQTLNDGEAGSSFRGKLNAMFTEVYAAIASLTSSLAGKQATLISGTTIKTINGVTLLGSGDLAVTAAVGSVRNRQTGDYTLVLGDNAKLVELNSGSPIVLTVPPNSSVAFTADQTEIELARYGSGSVTIAPGSGVTINSAGGALILTSQFSFATLKKIGTNEWYLVGDIS